MVSRVVVIGGRVVVRVVVVDGRVVVTIGRRVVGIVTIVVSRLLSSGGR